ncbi:MAG: hypothetical protein AAF528_01245 [Cyanobacteria bacterium P01_C01_bin.121]
MALIDDYQINLDEQWRDINAAVGTHYTVRDLYSLDMDLADEIGATRLLGYAAFPTAFDASTPTQITVQAGTYLTQRSYKRLSTGSVQTLGYDGEIFLMEFQASGYTAAIESDRFKTVTDGTNTGKLLDWDNAARKWWVRQTANDIAQNGAGFTITSGTGAGTTLASDGSQTGEEQFSGAFGLGDVSHWEATYAAQGSTVFDLVADEWYAAAPSSAFDILFKIMEAGSLINNGLVTVYNRCSRDLAFSIDSSESGDTYDWFTVDLTPLGNNPVPLNTRADRVDTLTDAQAEDYRDGTTSSITAATSGSPYNVDVNQDGSTEVYDAQVDIDQVANPLAYSAFLKNFFRKGSTTLINGVQAQLFTGLNTGYPVIKDSPMGTFSGNALAGAIAFARGWVPINLNADDVSDYTVVPNAGGNPVEPPTFRKREATGNPVGAKVTMFLETTPGSQIALRNEFTLAAGNSADNGTLVIKEAIPLDKPSPGVVRVFRDNGEEDHLAYSAFSGSTFTLTGTLSVTYSEDNNAYVGIIDESAATPNVAKTTRFVAPRNVVLRSRLGSGADKMEPFAVSLLLGDSDSSTPVTVSPDTINNN